MTKETVQLGEAPKVIINNNREIKKQLEQKDCQLAIEKKQHKF